MNTKGIPFTKEEILDIAKTYPTPFHIYDEKGIVDNIKAFFDAFSWAPGGGIRNYFAVKATPNPYILKLLKSCGAGADCSSIAELLLCEKVGFKGEDIMFSSNNTPIEEYKKALEMGAIINLDDISHIAYLEKEAYLPEFLCFRYNPGSLKDGGNAIIGLPEDAKYGMTKDQIIEAIRYCQAKGVTRFGIHTMVVSNELDIASLAGTATLMFNLAVAIKEETGVSVELIDLGGGVGVAYRPEQTPVDFKTLSAKVKESFDAIMVPNGLATVKLC